MIDGLNYLVQLIIKDQSFTPKKSQLWVPGKSFHIKNCEYLESIDIGGYSFSDYNGKFELINLPSLKSISIGKNVSFTGESNCFVYSSFTIRGMA